MSRQESEPNIQYVIRDSNGEWIRREKAKVKEKFRNNDKEVMVDGISDCTENGNPVFSDGMGRFYVWL